jgi:hypothetical protein
MPYGRAAPSTSATQHCLARISIEGERYHFGRKTSYLLSLHLKTLYGQAEEMTPPMLLQYKPTQQHCLPPTPLVQQYNP